MINEQEIEQRIEELKKQFIKTRENYIFKTYKLLNEIFKLRKRQFPRYTIADLSKEKGLDLTYHTIVYIFRLKDISPNTKKLIDSGRLRATSAIQLIKNTNVVRNDFNMQDKLVDKFLKGEVSIKKVSQMSKDNLVSFIEEEYNPLEEDRKILLRSIYELKRVANVISKNKEVFKIKEYRNKLMENNRILQLAINNLDAPRVTLSKSELVESGWDASGNESECENSSSKISTLSSKETSEEIKRPMALGVINKIKGKFTKK